MNDLEDALQRFGELEQRELLTGIAQLSGDATMLKDGVLLFRSTQSILNTFWLDAKETKAIFKDIVNKMDARECSYPREVFVIPLGAHTRPQGRRCYTTLKSGFLRLTRRPITPSGYVTSTRKQQPGF